MADETNDEQRGLPYLTGPADFAAGLPKASSFAEKGVECAPDDVLLVVKGSGAGTAAISDGRYVISRQLMALRAVDADPSYLKHVVFNARDQLARLATGTIPGISRDQILGLMAVFPRLSEQRRIAAVLGLWDDAIAAAEHLAVDHARIDQARLRRLLLPFAETELSDVASVVMGQSPLSSSYCELEEEDAVPLVQGAADFSGDRVTPQKATRAPTKVITANAVVMSVRAPVGTTALSRGRICLGRGVCAVVPRSMSLELMSAIIAATGSYWRTVAQGGTFEAVGSVEVRSAPVPHIPDHVRETLSDYATSLSRAQIARVERIALFRRQKRGLMQKLLTGEWRVPATGDPFAPGGPAADRLTEAAE